MTLFGKEVMRILKSMIYWLMVVSIVLFAYSQDAFPDEDVITEPAPGLSDYGMKASGDPALIMPEALQSLQGQYLANQYVAYPNGFIKYVKLNEADRGRMGSIIAELAGTAVAESTTKMEETDSNTIEIGADDLVQTGDGQFVITTPARQIQQQAALSPDITWDRFQALMDEADRLIGGGSDFSEAWLSHRFGQIPVTYAEAMEAYQETIAQDRYTGAHARLFSDYMGIIMALLPVFLAVFLGMRDRRNTVPVLYSRAVSSVRLIVTRYLALVVTAMLPILCMGGFLMVKHALQYGAAQVNMLAYPAYIFGWIMPCAMVSTAVGMAVTTLTGAPLAIGVQLVWWFVDLNYASGAYSFFGTRPLQLIPRHNSLGNTQVFMDGLQALVMNRLWMAGIALGIVILTVVILEMKRRGRLYVRIPTGSKVQLPS